MADPRLCFIVYFKFESSIAHLANLPVGSLIEFNQTSGRASLTIVKWFPSHKGYTSVHGLFKNNKWGIAHRYNMKANGTWSIPEKYVKNT